MSIGAQLNKGFLSKTVCILLSGKAGVGKSFYASALESKLSSDGYNVTRESFAKGVKRTATGMGWDGEKDNEGRSLLQKIGQCGREYNEDVWVKQTFDRLDDDDNYPFDVVLIDDWRFANEDFYIRTHQNLYDVMTVRIHAPMREILRGTHEYNEISEVALDDYDFKLTIHNWLDKEETLKSNVDLILKEAGLYP